MEKDAILSAIVERRFFSTTAEYLVRKKRSYFRRKSTGLAQRLCIRLITRVTPVKENRIIFLVQRGEYYCNAKYIAEELRRRNNAADIIWPVRRDASVQTADIPSDFTKVSKGTLGYYRYLASSKIIVDNCTETLSAGYKKKKDQILMNTWHGSIGIKIFSKETNKDQVWCRRAAREGRRTDYCISNSTFEDMVYRSSFWETTEILKLGHARNDILCWRDPQRLKPIRRKVFDYFRLDNVISQLKQQRHRELTCWYQEQCGQIPVTAEHLGKPNPFANVDLADPEAVNAFMEKEYAKCEDVRICLYAPTFRDDGDMRPYEIDYEQLRQALHTRFGGGDWIILTRFHYKLYYKQKKYVYPAGVINASNYPDIQELLVCTDVGITDYSSWICDYMLTRRPGFLFATDMEQYEKDNREFFYPLDSMPFPLAQNNAQLIQNILNFDDETFPAKCDAFLKDKGCMDDGHASQRIADFVETILKGEKR